MTAYAAICDEGNLHKIAYRLKQGGQLQLSHCGPEQQLCVQVDTSTAYGVNGDYLVLKGYTK